MSSDEVIAQIDVAPMRVKLYRRRQLVWCGAGIETQVGGCACVTVAACLDQLNIAPRVFSARVAEASNLLSDHVQQSLAAFCDLEISLAHIDIIQIAMVKGM